MNRNNIGIALFVLTLPLWLVVLILSFSFRIGMAVSDYILDDSLAEKVDKEI